MKEGEREVSFKSWMKGKNYDRYVDFLVEQSNGRSGKDLFDEYLKDGAKRPIKVDDSVKRSARDRQNRSQTCQGLAFHKSSVTRSSGLQQGRRGRRMRPCRS